MRVDIVHPGQRYGGGGIHLDYVARSLATAHDVHVHPGTFAALPKRPTTLAITRILSGLLRPDAWILPALPLAALGARAERRRVVGLFYHHDPTTQKWDWLDRKLERRLWDGLRAATRVVVIAEYWRQYLADRGVRSPVVIHTPFEVQRYRVTADEVEAFRATHRLTKRPVIYLGNCRPHKGTAEAWSVLRESGMTLVTSGRRMLDLPVPNIDGSARDYILLLAASDVVLTMSTFAEGWNRTAHEAMLVGTPVVGSGSGGMRELLAGGGQLICDRLDDLPRVVARALAERDALGVRGRRFAETFTIERFTTQWLELLAALDLP